MPADMSPDLVFSLLLWLKYSLLQSRAVILQCHSYCCRYFSFGYLCNYYIYMFRYAISVGGTDYSKWSLTRLTLTIMSAHTTSLCCRTHGCNHGNTLITWQSFLPLKKLQWLSLLLLLIHVQPVLVVNRVLNWCFVTFLPQKWVTQRICLTLSFHLYPDDACCPLPALDPASEGKRSVPLVLVRARERDSSDSANGQSSRSSSFSCKRWITNASEHISQVLLGSFIWQLLQQHSNLTSTWTCEGCDVWSGNLLGIHSWSHSPTVTLDRKKTCLMKTKSHC